MASNDGLPGGDGREAVLEWPVPKFEEFIIANRNIGSSSTVSILLTFSSPSSLDSVRVTQRITEVQQLWPLLSITIADHRTPNPKIRYHSRSWDVGRILYRETYNATPSNPNRERDWVYDKALRLAQTKTASDSDPLWRVALFYATSDPENHRVYLSLAIDHLLIDGRGAVKLAKALVTSDISDLPKEDITVYKAMHGKDYSGFPPLSFIIHSIFSMMVAPRLPNFIQRPMGYIPAWPRKITQPTIDSPWKSSILDIPSSLMQELKVIGKHHGIATLNPTLHTAWVLALWAVFIPEKKRKRLCIKDTSVKDIRDISQGDSYCLGTHSSTYLWSSGRMNSQSRFWELAKSYRAASMDSKMVSNSHKIMQLVVKLKNREMKPERCRYRSPNATTLPAGDKRAYTRFEEGGLRKINSTSPYGGTSGIWSNLSYVPLPEGAIDMLFGVSGNDLCAAFNTCVLGHEGGVRLVNAFSDGAAMTLAGVKKAEELFVRILGEIAAEGGRDWLVGDLVKNKEG
ncbi:uncharacterized protein E0L32_006072 [Thyridium curvatum]|uniref:Alcohol acetyltransferase n=1 Tax=Thyridium curvatum TaxID=1093900 RepID=A0A507B963_9PEZI|nr:uncharacterized protein E0L32_006072 [Thyridium curvatum]TPX13601.1 hypothetical protein E0L32_006072 [Thyridium curvatum]